MKEKLAAIWAAIKADAVDTYKRLKILLLAILAAVIYLEGTKIKDAIIAFLAKKEMDTTVKEDATLASQEKSDKDQADALIAHANALPDQQPPVTQDWYKKDQK